MRDEGGGMKKETTETGERDGITASPVGRDSSFIPHPSSLIPEDLPSCLVGVFCSLTSPQAAFIELRRVVRPGGQIVLLEHVRPNGLMGYLFDALNVLTVALFDDHFNRRTAEEAGRAGLKLLRVERHALGIINLIVCRVEKSDEGGLQG